MHRQYFTTNILQPNLIYVNTETIQLGKSFFYNKDNELLMVQFHSYNQYLRGYEHIKLTL